MLHVGASVFCKFNSSFHAECVVRPPSKRVAAIPDDAIANAILFCDRMVAKISDRRKVLPVPPCASMRNSPPLCSVIARIILSYAMLCSRINCSEICPNECQFIRISVSLVANHDEKVVQVGLKQVFRYTSAC
ncbi:transposon Tf2-6 polyprotein [Trichonephila clavipes]|nr:transposon Tf2-6 polyprotein [Trichonephila clavipes]